MNNTVHVTYLFDDLIDGTLPADQRASVEQHLATCDACQQAFANHQTLVAELNDLPQSITPERDLWDEIAPQLQPAGVTASPRLSLIRSVYFRAAAIAAVLLVGVYVATTISPAWQVTPLEGTAEVAGSPIYEASTIREGQWLFTPTDARARLQVGDIGDVELAPDTRLQLVNTASGDHRLHLAAGSIHASIWAPPRLFFVETPAGLAIDKTAIDRELWRRQQGYGRGGRMKIETDTVELLSGVRHGKALGSPVAMMIRNDDFVHWQEVMSSEVLDQAPKNPRTVTRPRPGHADLAGGQKYGTRDLRDILERASARETAARVASGALAKLLLAQFGIEVRSHVVQLGGVPAAIAPKTWDEIAAVPDDAPLNCADAASQAAMVEAIDAAKAAGDTLGGVYEIVVRGLPIGLGSHTSWEEKLDGRIARAIMSIHATKAVEIGDGIANAARRGSAAHDEIGHDGSSFTRPTNRAGGLEGGITNGEELRVRGYMKPIATLRTPLRSVDIGTKDASDAAFERSDITAVPAAGVIGEAMLAVVLANAMREKFGGDSIDEMRRNYDSYIQALAAY